MIACDDTNLNVDIGKAWFQRPYYQLQICEGYIVLDIRHRDIEEWEERQYMQMVTNIWLKKKRKKNWSVLFISRRKSVEEEAEAPNSRGQMIKGTFWVWGPLL